MKRWKAERRFVKKQIAGAAWEVWLALCEMPLWKRLVLAARLAAGKPKGVLGTKGKSE